MVSLDRPDDSLRESFVFVKPVTTRTIKKETRGRGYSLDSGRSENSHHIGIPLSSLILVDKYLQRIVGRANAQWRK